MRTRARPEGATRPGSPFNAKAAGVVRPPSLPLRDVEVGQRTFDRFRSARHRLGECWMRMNRESDIGRIRAALDRERDLADQLAGIRADDAAAEHPVRLWVEQQLRET